MQEMNIDYVVPYVNSRDSVWISEYRKYVSGTCDWSNNASRFRDWGILKYQLRSLCKHTPWIHRIFIVVSISESQVPDWLNTDNPRIRVVLDSEFLPKENLPIFNSNVIDLYIPRIKDLAEHYLYACDDYLVLKDLCMSDFFDGDSIKLKLEMRTLHKCTYTRTIANSNRFFDNNLVTDNSYPHTYNRFFIWQTNHKLRERERISILTQSMRQWQMLAHDQVDMLTWEAMMAQSTL